ncbi:MAG TPA: ABC transporter permease [Gemmatimonadales bacterium]
MDALLHDLRLTVRQLSRQRGYTVAAILTLGLALGATTAVFSVVSGVLLRPLPFPDASELVTICERHPSVEGFCIASPPDVEDWRAASATLAAVGIARDWPVRITESDKVESVYGGLVTHGVFAALGIQPALGRVMGPDDHGPSHRVAVLSDALWRTRFGAEPAVVGRAVSLDGEPVTIIGVLAPATEIPDLEDVQIWMSLPFDPGDEENRGWRGFGTVARLAPGATREAAAAELATIAGRLGATYPETNAGWQVEVVGLQDSLVGGVRRRLLVFLGAVGLVLLLGCVNLANLMLARVSGREQELAIRAAIGAGRGRLARLLLLESVLVSGAGAVLGVLLASWGVDLFRSVAPPGIPRLDEIVVDWRVLLFALGLAAVTALLIGGMPALRGARADLAAQLHASRVARGGGRGLLVAAETAIAVMLLAGAALLGRTFARLTAWDPGFAPDRVLVAWTGVSSGTYRDVTAVRALYAQALDAVRSLPGVASASLTSGGPAFGGEEPGMARAGGPESDSTVVLWRNVGPEYFATLGVPLRSGRDITVADRAGTTPVAIVNEAAARRLWPGRSPIGERLVMPEMGLEFSVIGLVADIPALRPDAPPRPEVFWPFFQLPRWGGYIVVRAEGGAPGLAAAVRDRLREVSPELEPAQVSALDEVLGRRLVSPRFNVLLLGSFAGVALLLAAVGITGLVAYRVTHRVREIGIRLALGATDARVVSRFVWEGGRLVLLGVAIGTLGALGLTRLLGSMLAGTSPTDPATFAAVVLGMLGVGLAAAWLPARRASRVDPLTALRAE